MLRELSALTLGLYFDTLKQEGFDTKNSKIKNSSIKNFIIESPKIENSEFENCKAGSFKVRTLGNQYSNNEGTAN